MKKIYYILLTVTLSLFAASCSKDSAGEDFIVNRAELAEVTFLGENGYFEMKWDQDGSLLRVVENMRPDYKVEEGQRVYCVFRILRSEKSSYDIKLIDFHPLSSSQSYKMSDVNSNDDLLIQIGNDPVFLYGRVWMVRSWLNVEIGYYRENDDREHRFSVIWDDTRHDTGLDGIPEVYFVLRHNAGRNPNEEPGIPKETSAMGSYDISAVMGNFRDKDVKVYLEWMNYDINGNLVPFTEEVGTYNFSKAVDGYTVITEKNHNYIGAPVDTSTFVR